MVTAKLKAVHVHGHLDFTQASMHFMLETQAVSQGSVYELLLKIQLL